MNELEMNIEPVSWNQHVPFHCDRCGTCCRHAKLSILVDSLDTFHLARFIKSKGYTKEDAIDMVLQCLEPLPIHDSGYFMYTLKTWGKEASCIFLRSNRCTIQDAKPRACRIYPFSAEADANGRFTYFLCKEKSHHFTGVTVKAQDWIKHNFTRDDHEFVKTDFSVAIELVRLLKQIPESRKKKALFYFLRYRFIEFDLEKPFLEQFLRNHELLIEKLKELTI